MESTLQNGVPPSLKSSLVFSTQSGLRSDWRTFHGAITSVTGLTYGLQDEFRFRNLFGCPMCYLGSPAHASVNVRANYRGCNLYLLQCLSLACLLTLYRWNMREGFEQGAPLEMSILYLLVTPGQLSLAFGWGGIKKDLYPSGPWTARINVHFIASCPATAFVYSNSIIFATLFYIAHANSMFPWV